MADSWNWPALINKIAQDIPFLQRALNALLKQDPTSINDAPSGSKRLYEVSSGKWQWQEYNGSSWAPVPFLQHNVDQIDGYHAAITPAANTVAVRNASGLLQDSITGNAATASSAVTLSQTLPVNKGGTGATTSEAARSNLGVPPTSHASTATTYGVGNATQYGHLKLSDAVDSASGATGGTAATPAAVKAAKDAADAAQSSANNAQSSADAAMTKASTIATSSTPGIVKPGTGLTVDAAGALKANTSSASTPGLVKSSVTALAGAVPVGGADGTLGEDWLKKAMDAAAAAQTAADEAKNKRPHIVVRGSRSSPGHEKEETWTLTNIDIDSPLYISHKTTQNEGNANGALIRGTSGIKEGYVGQASTVTTIYGIGSTTPGADVNKGAPIIMFRPTSSTITLKLHWYGAYSTLEAWQYEY